MKIKEQIIILLLLTIGVLSYNIDENQTKNLVELEATVIDETLSRAKNKVIRTLGKGNVATSAVNVYYDLENYKSEKEYDEFKMIAASALKKLKEKEVIVRNIKKFIENKNKASLREVFVSNKEPGYLTFYKEKNLYYGIELNFKNNIERIILNKEEFDSLVLKVTLLKFGPSSITMKICQESIIRDLHVACNPISKELYFSINDNYSIIEYSKLGLIQYVGK